MLSAQGCGAHLTVAKAGGARGGFRPLLSAGFVMLVPDRFCLALWLVLSGLRSVLRRLWSLMRLHGQHRATYYSRRFGRVIFQDGIRCWPVTASRRFGCSTSRLREPTVKGAMRRQRRPSRSRTLPSESGSGGGTDRLKSATGICRTPFTQVVRDRRRTRSNVLAASRLLVLVGLPGSGRTSASRSVAPAVARRSQ
jgi:hypothetical protein